MERFLRTVVRVVGGAIIALIVGYILMIIGLFALWMFFASKGISEGDAVTLILGSIPYGRFIAIVFVLAAFVVISTLVARVFDRMWRNESSLAADFVAVLIILAIFGGGYLRIQAEQANGKAEGLYSQQN